VGWDSGVKLLVPAVLCAEGEEGHQWKMRGVLCNLLLFCYRSFTTSDLLHSWLNLFKDALGWGRENLAPL